MHKRNPSTLVGMQIGRAIIQNDIKFLKNNAERVAYDPALGRSKGKLICQWDARILIFPSALPEVSKIKGQHNLH